MFVVMRVIAGMAKGRLLAGPPGPRQRPTSDRVREAVFDMLASLGGVAGWSVLDLFAGTGAMGLEALSRGAASVVFVERDEKALGALRSNLAHVSSHLVEPGVVGTSTRGDVTAAGSVGPARHSPDPCGWRVVRADVMSFVAHSGRFDLALCDPPYAFDDWDSLLASLRARLVVVESNRELVHDQPGWEMIRSRRHGLAVVSVLQATGQALAPGVGAGSGSPAHGSPAYGLQSPGSQSPGLQSPGGNGGSATVRITERLSTHSLHASLSGRDAPRDSDRR